MSSADIFDGLLSFEDEFYNEGYELGDKDGARAGYNEGDVFAVEKGYEKFLQMGKLYGKAIVWAKRLPGEHGLLLQSQSELGPKDAKAKRVEEEGPEAASNANKEKKEETQKVKLAPLSASSSRLEKHIAQLLHLVDPTTLSYENTEEGVEDFDDRLKRANAKVKLIERILGEQSAETSFSQAQSTGNIEDISSVPAHVRPSAD